MPISSLQINQMIAGQQAMFGNAATYAQQISPMGQAMGMAPSYAQPYGPMAIPGAQEYNQGAAAAPGILNAAASYGAPIMMGAGMMMGGRVGGMLDPTTAAFRGFGAGAGWQSGAGITANLGNIARGGIGGIARGIGMAGLYAAPVMAGYGIAKYALGQMAEGAQFQNQVNASLQNAFRFTNPQSQTGYGFSQVEQRQIGSMLQGMGTQDMMTTPQELLGLVNRGAQMGVFRGVQDAREFRQKFTEMKNSLKEIAQTFNTTLSEAVPFFQQARSQGFWTPQDITRHATQVRQVQSTTGMSAAQAQSVMGMGAQMVRSIGGTGQQGSEMMARAQMISGSMLRGGWISSAQLGEAGFGTGAEGAQNFGMMMAGAATRFARSGVGRWALASLMNKEGTGLDQAGLQYLAAGGMGIGEMGARARRNVSGGRAYQFVMNEEQLRGQLAEAGPEATMGFVRGIIGSRLYGSGGRDQLITRRLIQRFMGGTTKQADMFAQAMRNMPQILSAQAAASEGSLDAQEQQNERMMNDTWEGFKRKIGQTWREKVTNPLREAGADFSFRVGRAWSRFSDRLFGTGGRGVGLSAEAVRAMVRSAETGNMAYMERDIAGGDLMTRTLGAGVFQGGTVGIAGSDQMRRLGFSPMRGAQTTIDAIQRGAGSGWMAAASPFAAAAGWAGRQLFGRGAQFSTGDIREMQALSRASMGGVGEEEALAIGYGGAGAMREAMGGAGARQVQEFLRTGEALALRGRFGRGELGAEDQERYGQAILGRIQAGRAGEQARQMFAGVSGRQALGRLMAAQGGARGGYSGLGGLGEEMRLRQGQTLREAVEEAGVTATEDLARTLRGGVTDAWYTGGMGRVVAAMSGGIQGVAVTEQSIEELKKDTRGERAMKLFSQANEAERNGASADEVTRLRRKARGLMAEIGNDKNTSETARSAAIKMSNEADPAAESIAKSAGKAGDAIRTEAAVALSQTWARRRERFERTMGAEGMERLERMAGGDKSGLGQAFREAMQQTGTGPGGLITGKDMMARMTRLAEAAAADPDKAAQMMAYMKSEGLDKTDVGQVMGRAMVAATEAKTIGVKQEIASGAKITARARSSVRAELERLGITPTAKEEEALIRGEAAGSERVRGLLERAGFDPGDIKEKLGALRGGMTVEETKKARMRGAVAGGFEVLSEKVAKRAGLDPSELTGKLGERDSATVQELKIHTVWFQKMHEALGMISRDEKMPKKNAKDTK